MLFLQKLFLLLDLKLDFVDQLPGLALLFLCNLLDGPVELLHALRTLHLDTVIFVHLLDEGNFARRIFAASQDVDVEQFVRLLVVVERHVVEEVKLQEFVHDVVRVVTADHELVEAHILRAEGTHLLFKL